MGYIILYSSLWLIHLNSRKKAIYDMASKTEQVSSQDQEHTMSDNAGHLAYHEVYIPHYNSLFLLLWKDDKQTDNCSTTSAPADLMQLQISGWYTISIKLLL